MAVFLRHVPRPEARAAALSLVVALTLAAVKFGAYFLTGSAAIFSDALESVVNIAAAGVAIYSLALAHRPADREHPYGHGKIEFLSGSFEGGMIVLAAVVIAVKAIDALLRGQWVDTEMVNAGMALTIAALLVNGAVGAYVIHAGRTHGSMTLEADGWHLLSDAITSAVVIVALLVVRVTGYAPADPIAALLVAGYLTVVGVRLLRRAGAGLMDRQDVGDDRLLRELLDAHVGANGREPRICSYHKLRHRHSGRYHWIDFHIAVPAHWDVRRGHDLASTIEYEIEQALGDGKATAHIEPCLEADCQRCDADPHERAQLLTAPAPPT